MGFTKEQLLDRLKELQIDFSVYDHPVVLTVEAQAKYVGNSGGALSKNLFLKDKKHRYYVISALSTTNIDLKVLSQRLGLGKGGIRMTPQESLQEILQVPLGCVTPFALINESARSVSLLLDKGFKAQESCFFHPLLNDATISVSSTGLDKFLTSIGRTPSYVDLEANPPVGKDQPPDLAAFVPAEIPDVQLDNTSSSVNIENGALQGNSPTTKTEASKSSSITKPIRPAPKSEIAHQGMSTLASVSNVSNVVDEIINKTSSLVLSEITGESIQLHGEQLGSVVSNSLRKHLDADLQNLIMVLKNAAYSQGFHAGLCSSGLKKR